MEVLKDPAFEKWSQPQRILVILAHPDDPEFYCRASVAAWTEAGHQVAYCLLTSGDKGSKDRTLTPQAVVALREGEQRRAAAALGVSSVTFLGCPDGYLVPDLPLRRDITRVIRQVRPDVLVTCDPTTLFIGDTYVNHPDHRAAGQAVIDAVFPAARDHLYFPELLEVEQLEPHVVRELWVCGSLTPNVILDVTAYWDRKIEALLNHKSQIGETQAFIERMHSRRDPDSPPENPRYLERFRRMVIG